ncbi:MAG TPA: hypothetical protein DD666_00665 [Advenella kashmirensis]|uniref:DUF4325 domain-containing protein n=1 Tax=Advenella kashmirensis TaxID=310575 RepID=A0A356LBH3_9BURK|nr:hypothetical protein [Advenella kashmirensis]
MFVHVLNYVQHCQTNADGDKIFNVIAPALLRGETVTVSFKGVISLPSSFVNSAFIPLLNDLSFEQIKKQLRFQDTNSQMNSMIKSRFDFEINRGFEAVH